MNLIDDPKAHALTLADMIRQAAEGHEVGSVRAHREQWAIVIAALEAYASSSAQPDGYAVVMSNGAFVGIWHHQSIAQMIVNRSPSAKGERIEPMYFVDQSHKR